MNRVQNGVFCSEWVPYEPKSDLLGGDAGPSRATPTRSWPRRRSSRSRSTTAAFGTSARRPPRSARSRRAASRPCSSRARSTPSPRRARPGSPRRRSPIPPWWTCQGSGTTSWTSHAAASSCSPLSSLPQARRTRAASPGPAHPSSGDGIPPRLRCRRRRKHEKPAGKPQERRRNRTFQPWGCQGLPVLKGPICRSFACVEDVVIVRLGVVRSGQIRRVPRDTGQSNDPARRARRDAHRALGSVLSQRSQRAGPSASMAASIVGYDGASCAVVGEASEHVADLPDIAREHQADSVWHAVPRALRPACGPRSRPRTESFRRRRSRRVRRRHRRLRGCGSGRSRRWRRTARSRFAGP